ncbi:MAG: GNAT family N-acetyltransferase, partial [Candidatus Paceibacteria bacterium]
VGDISAFQRLKNDVFGAQENLIKAENDLQEKLSGKMSSGRMIQDIKEKISKAKEELRKKLDVLETRIENFKTNLPELISPCLNKERSESLIQKIERKLTEQFDHYNTDRNTLANLFSESRDKKKDKLENQPMSIFVWARNPDFDLYQGNYTNCCIRIDSEHNESESTIADYNTDLGIQIVNIWDETKNEPVTAAWCWLGKNKEAVLVVDNIESNTLYSANYPKQLTKELFDYLKKYAKSIGVKKIVLGKANNDLPTPGELAKMKDDGYTYKKIGGYNRIDGYFLEAEDKSVKIVWEANPTAVKAKADKGKEKQTEKIKFTNLNIKNLTENDFAKLKQLERKIYQNTNLILGSTMIEDIKQGKGLEYSIIVNGQKSAEKGKEAIGYLVAVEDKTDEGNPCVYLEDIAVIPEAQGQAIGWKMLQDLIGKLKEKARRKNKPVLLDMHLREDSQRFMEKYNEQLEEMGVKLIEEALVPDYYEEGEDALYKVYEIK